jgi:putative transposase
MGSVVALHPQLRTDFPEIDAVVRGVDLWLSAQEIAELGNLPGLPGGPTVQSRKRRINDFAKREFWHRRVGSDGTALVRTRKGRGGGIEYHIDVLPSAARAKILLKRSPVPTPVVPAGGDSEVWNWFDQRTDETKAEAANRLLVVTEIEQSIASGTTVTAAISAVAARLDIGIATISNWRAAIKGVPRTDWLPYLANKRVGGGKKANIDPELWRHLVSQALTASGQPFAAVYADVKKIAKAQGKSLPSYRTLKRRFEKEIDPLVALRCREGSEALERAVPSLIRDRSHMHAMQMVNIDGHRWDVRVEWPDGTISRPMMVAIQDVYSSKLLAWNIDKEENAVSVRKAFEKLLRQYGVPISCLCDNGRAFACKWITGGSDTRNRWSIKADDPLGLLPALGIKVEWAQPYHGQSKPIERAFRWLEDRIGKSPEFSGAYTGRSTLHKPHDYGRRAIPLAEFIEVVDRRIAELNAETGRKTQMAAGKRSVDDVFNESYAAAPIGKATPVALALALMDAKKAKTHRHDGSVNVVGNRYWSEDLSRIPGQEVVVRYNPEDLNEAVRVYTLAGALITVAALDGLVQFNDIAGANLIKQRRKKVRDAVNKQIKAYDLLDAAELAEINKRYAIEPELPEPTVIRPVRHRGQTAAALQPVAAIAPQATGEASLKLVSARDQSNLKAASNAASIDRIAAALARQRRDED